MRVDIAESPLSKYKLRATFTDDSGKKVKHTDFGARGMGDYTVYYKQNPELGRSRREAYLKRHKAREDWSNYMSAGSLSRWILWEEPTVSEAVRKYKSRFGLK